MTIIKLIKKYAPEFDEEHIERLANATYNKDSITRFLVHFKRKLLREHLKNMKKRGGKYSH